MQNWVTTALDILQRKKAFVLVTVIRTQGSVPRETGTKMFVTDNNVIDTIGGGNFEFIVIEQCRKMLATNNSDVRLQHYPLGPLTRQCCGGRVSVLLEMITLLQVPLLRSFVSAIKSENGLTLVTDFSKKSAKKSLTHGLVDTPSIRDFERNLFACNSKDLSDKNIAAFLEPLPTPQIPLYIFGAGHVGRAVVDIVSKLPFRIIWVDPRPNEFPNVLPYGVTKVTEGDFIALINEAPSNAYYLIFTHSHPLDFSITAAILEKGDFIYCGLIGSATKKARFKSRFFKECNLDEAQLSRLTCPVGIECISGKEPIKIAVSISAQLIQTLEATPYAYTHY